MKVLHCITKTELGGSQSHVLDLIKARSAADEYMLCAGQEGWLIDAVRDCGVPTYVVTSLVRQINPLQDFVAVWELYQLFRALQPDVVHLHTAKAGVVGRIAARMAGVACVYSPHGWAFSPRSGRALRVLSAVVERLLSCLTDHVICASEVELGIAEQNGITRHVVCSVIHHGIADCVEVVPKSDELRVVMIARFAPPKEQEFVLTVFAKLELAARLVFVGDGPTMERVQRHCRLLGMENRVDFLGNRTDVGRILSGCDVLVHASAYEAFGLTVLEAMRAGIPVVATATGALMEIVRNGETGILCAHGDAESFRYAVSRLLRDPELRTRMGQAARQCFVSEFSVDKMNASTVALYRLYAPEQKQTT